MDIAADEHPGDSHARLKTEMWVEYRVRAVGLIGQHRQDSEGQQRQLDGGFEIRFVQPVCEGMQLYFEGQQRREQHSGGGAERQRPIARCTPLGTTRSAAASVVTPGSPPSL